MPTEPASQHLNAEDWAEATVRDIWDVLRYRGHGNKKAVGLAGKSLLAAIAVRETDDLTREFLERDYGVSEVTSLASMYDEVKDALAAARRELAALRSTQRTIYAIATQFEGAPDEFRCWCRTCCAARLPEHAPAPPAGAQRMRRNIEMKLTIALFLLSGFAAGQACKSAVVRNDNDRRAKAWNCEMVKVACTAKPGNDRGVEAGRHYVCDEQKAPNPGPLSGYHVVFFTDGCSECAVGWLYVKGERCGDHDLNCMD